MIFAIDRTEVPGGNHVEVTAAGLAAESQDRTGWGMMLGGKPAPLMLESSRAIAQRV